MLCSLHIICKKQHFFADTSENVFSILHESQFEDFTPFMQFRSWSHQGNHVLGDLLHIICKNQQFSADPSENVFSAQCVSEFDALTSTSWRPFLQLRPWSHQGNHVLGCMCFFIEYHMQKTTVFLLYIIYYLLFIIYYLLLFSFIMYYY